MVPTKRKQAQRHFRTEAHAIGQGHRIRNM